MSVRLFSVKCFGWGGGDGGGQWPVAGEEGREADDTGGGGEQRF